MLLCDICRQRPADGYLDRLEWPDAATMYCRRCAEEVPGIVWFDTTLGQPNTRNAEQTTFRFWKRDEI